MNIIAATNTQGSAQRTTGFEQVRAIGGILWAMDRKKELTRHLYRLVNVIRSAQLKRSLTSVDPNPPLNFWRLIYGNLLDVAVLEWCKIFGTDSEPTHWKKIVTDQNEFRTNLLSSLNINNETWNAYWEEMKNYRDNLISHHIEDRGPSAYPKLDLALESSYYYYSYLIQELTDLGITKFPNDPKAYSEHFADQATEIAKKALDATAGIPEKAG